MSRGEQWMFCVSYNPQHVFICHFLLLHFFIYSYFIIYKITTATLRCLLLLVLLLKNPVISNIAKGRGDVYMKKKKLNNYVEWSSEIVFSLTWMKIEVLFFAINKNSGPINNLALYLFLSFQLLSH